MEHEANRRLIHQFYGLISPERDSSKAPPSLVTRQQLLDGECKVNFANCQKNIIFNFCTAKRYDSLPDIAQLKKDRLVTEFLNTVWPGVSADGDDVALKILEKLQNWLKRNAGVYSSGRWTEWKEPWFRMPPFSVLADQVSGSEVRQDAGEEGEEVYGTEDEHSESNGPVLDHDDAAQACSDGDAEDDTDVDGLSVQSAADLHRSIQQKEKGRTAIGQFLAAPASNFEPTTMDDVLNATKRKTQVRALMATDWVKADISRPSHQNSSVSRDGESIAGIREQSQLSGALSKTPLPSLTSLASKISMQPKNRASSSTAHYMPISPEVSTHKKTNTRPPGGKGKQRASNASAELTNAYEDIFTVVSEQFRQLGIKSSLSKEE